ncbi:MAG: glycosyltransferase family 1 protein [Cyanobacteria bacterium]|nr:glycosyltransferase family 1 protein [Cyanobacteriota bacterium]
MNLRTPSDAAAVSSGSVDLICLCHLRWNFVFQRPQHLMSRYARTRRVFFVEEPLFEDVAGPRVSIEARDGVLVVVPTLPRSYTPDQALVAQRAVMDQLIQAEGISRFVLWYYTPLAMKFAGHLKPAATVYDCMDELSAFKNAPAELVTVEQQLLRCADVVFTGGQSLYEAKKHRHKNIHAMPSSVDVAHFAAARKIETQPADQRHLARPRLGFYGVLDERLDIALLDGIAEARPDWQFVMLGPVVKIDPADLPRRPNIHYLGSKKYDELPAYIAGWDLALLLFARNEATRFISPTKTPEYLAAGKPVVSTSIRDVVSPYGDRDLVRIADSVPDFVRACEAALSEPPEPRRVRADVFLRGTSWDRTWAKTAALLDAAMADQPSPQPDATPSTQTDVTPSAGLGLSA